MRFIILFFAFFLTAHTSANRWGATGHSVVGDIAAHYLTDEAREEMNRILGHESLAIASTWMDEIRSDPAYDYTHDWHWVTIPEGMSYEETEKNSNGDIINALRTMIADLKGGGLSAKQEEEKLKMIIHLVGDIHMPLHVGTGEDRGGNSVRVEWFWEQSNLHRVWDSGMIDEYGLSYTELSTAVNHPSEAEVRQWQSDDILDWARESMELREQVYDLPEDNEINYKYMYHNFDTVEKRLMQAGVRLAGVINEIYGE